MVGKKTTTKGLRFADLSMEFIGAPFCAMGTSKEEGYDCFTLVRTYLKRSGFDLPDNYECDGFNFKNYYKLWSKNPEKGIEVMCKFLEEYAGRIELKDIQIGDIMIVKNFTNHVNAGIYGGNDKIIAADIKYGVIALPLRHFKIIDSFRGKK
jgi:cell wall-associated NlpC family hydrolase